MTILEGVDPKLLSGALAIVNRLNRHQFETYFAGGAVRDLLLGNTVSDIDLATSASPDEVESLFDRTIPVGKQFGVMVVVIDSTNYEVTTFRSESGYLDGRHPTDVHFTDARQDAERRDFTVNALFLNPVNEQILDYVNGGNDLERKVIRTVGSPVKRFREDKLRLLRAVRFACQLNFEIAPETYNGIREYAGDLNQVSWERIRDEVLKILTGSAPERGLRLLLECGILAVILPEIAAMNRVPQPPEFHPEGDVFEHTCLMFELSGRLSDTLALGILLHDVGKPPTFAVKERIRFDGHVEVGVRMAQKMGRRLRLSSEQIEETSDLVKNHLRFMNVRQMRESKLKRFLRKENFDLHLELHRLDCLASHGDLSNYDFCREKLKEFDAEAIRPQPLLNGDDLIGLKLTPGPVFSEILTAVEDLQLEEQLGSKEEALTWVREHYLNDN